MFLEKSCNSDHSFLCQRKQCPINKNTEDKVSIKILCWLNMFRLNHLSYLMFNNSEFGTWGLSSYKNTKTYSYFNEIDLDVVVTTESMNVDIVYWHHINNTPHKFGLECKKKKKSWSKEVGIYGRIPEQKRWAYMASILET